MSRLGIVLLIGLAFLAWGSEAKAQAPTVTVVPVKPIMGPGTSWNFPAGGTYNGGTAMVTKVTVTLKRVPMNGGPEVVGVPQSANWGGGNYTIVINNTTYLPLANDYYMRATVFILQNNRQIEGNTCDWVLVPK